MVVLRRGRKGTDIRGRNFRGLIFKTVEAKIGLILWRESTECRVNDRAIVAKKKEGHLSPQKI